MSLSHEEAKLGGFAEAYVSSRLSPAERDAFETHLFTCGECWDDVEALKNVRAGGEDAGRRGLSFPPEYWKWVFAAAATVLIGLVSWTALVRDPGPERDPAAAQSRPTVAQAPANLPVLRLEASRPEGATVLAVPAGARHVSVWLAAPPAGRPFRLEFRNRENEPVQILAGLFPNAQGALTAAMPAEPLRKGTYTARLYAAGGALAGEYTFAVKTN